MSVDYLNPHIEAIGLVCRCGGPAPDEAPICFECNEAICAACKAVPAHLEEQIDLHVICQENRDERAFDQQYEDYHGSSAPQTDRERGEIAARERGKVR